MQKSAVLALAIVFLSVGCTATPDAPVPTSPSSFERQAGITDTSTHQGSIAMTLGATLDDQVIEFSEELAGTIDIDLLEMDVDAAPDSAAPIFDVPGKPIAKVSIDGMEIRLTWTGAPPGKAGPATRFYVYCNCTGKVEMLGPGLPGMKTWKATKPGTYTGYVHAWNSKGSGPTFNFKVTVPGDQGIYTGAAAKGVGSFKRVFTGGSCTWRVTFTVTPTVYISPGPLGSTRLVGGYVAPSPRYPCQAASGSFAITKPLAFTATTFSSTHTIDVADMKFLGSLVNGIITGKVTITYRYGDGQIVIPVTLKKT